MPEPVVTSPPKGCRIELAGAIEESNKANNALLPVFPIMFVLMLTVIVFQVRSLSAMVMVTLTAPLGLVGTVLAFSSTVWMGRNPGASGTGWHSDAQHADIDRSDSCKSA